MSATTTTLKTPMPLPLALRDSGSIGSTFAARPASIQLSRGRHELSKDVLTYDFAVSRGHNIGDEDFPTTNFTGINNLGAVNFSKDPSNPYRPRIYAPHVFDRFFREDASRSRETGGAGLGLPICKAIVEKAGDVFEIESEKDRGTIVKVRLPRSARGDQKILFQDDSTSSR